MASPSSAQQIAQGQIPTYTASQIQPCTSLFDADTNGHFIGCFHLLNCGHIVVIADLNRLCGRNCAHMQNQPSDSLHGSVVTKTRFLNALDTSGLRPQPDSETSISSEVIVPLQRPLYAFDLLYCEVCTGIPFERRYPLGMSPELIGDDYVFFPRYRHCHGLTQRQLQNTLVILPEEANAMLSGVFPHPQLQQIEQKHRLQCGHTVYSLSHACAANCSTIKTCNPDLTDWIVLRSINAIVCAECVSRAELLLRRHAIPPRL